MAISYGDLGLIDERQGMRMRLLALACQAVLKKKKTQ